MTAAALVSPQTFGAKVRAARRAQDLTQIQLARMVGRSAPFICCVEKGYVTPSPDEQRQLAVALKLPVRSTKGRA